MRALMRALCGVVLAICLQISTAAAQSYQVPETPLVTGPNFEQTNASDILVTPTGMPTVALGDALAAGGKTNPGGSNLQIQFNNNGIFGGMATTGSGNVALATSPTLTGAPLFPGTPTFTNTLQIQDSGARSAAVSLVFPTYAAFIAFDPTTIGATMVTASTAGYYAAGDGGASTYDWVSTSTLPPDPAQKGAAYGTNGIFVVKPTPISGNGRWILRMPGGTIHPEQAGAKCDSATNDINPLQNLTLAISSTTLPSSVLNSVIISLNPNKYCLLSALFWNVGANITISGATNALGSNNVSTNYQLYTSGFIVNPANSYINLGTGDKLTNLQVKRQNLPVAPTTFQAEFGGSSGVGQWYSENGNVSNLAIVSGGTGCQVGDFVVLTGGLGNFAWVQVTSVSGSGTSTVVTGVTLAYAGNYYSFPATPNTTRNVPAGGTASNCITFPHVSFTTGTLMSVGVVASNVVNLENVQITGFYDPLFANVINARDLSLDGVNGLDITNSGGNTFVENAVAISTLGTSVTSFGVWTVTSVQSGGTLNQAGDVLTVQGTSCTTPPQVTVDTVSSGAIATSHISTYGDCATPPTTNPATMNNLHSGTAATLNLLWVEPGFRPGIAFWIHDECTGCYFANLQVHGYRYGMQVSNTGFTYIHGASLESSSFTSLPAPPTGWNYGLDLENCVNAQFYGITVNGYASGYHLYNTTWQHAPLPGVACGSQATTEAQAGGASQIFGGSIGSPWANYTYGVDIGPYSFGLVSGVRISQPTTKPVNVGANVYGWQLRDIGSYGNSSAINWLTVDSTSVGAVMANAVQSGEGTPAPYVYMGGLPANCTGQLSKTLYSNSGVLTVCP